MENSLICISDGSNDFVQLNASYVFIGTERKEFLALISRTQVPTGYRSTLIKYAGQQRLVGLKSHDHHYMIQQVLHASMRNLLDKGVRETIIKVGHLFQQLCIKVVDPGKTKELETFAVEAPSRT